jgi:Icc-related predicted phosphoesterase
MPDTILFISDIHANYHVIDAQVEHAETELGIPIKEVLVLGDFGFFGDDLHAYFRRQKRRFRCPVAFIEGNHEDHGALENLADSYADVITHLRRGSLHHAGRWRCLCLGGARYMDAWSTPRGCEISQADVAASLAHAPDAVDLVITHDCPVGIGVPNTPGLEHYGQPGVPELNQIAEHYRPPLWIFGHHHRWHEVTHEGTRYLGLPQSWVGYALLDAEGEVRRVEHEVPIRSSSRWRRWFGLR